LCAYTKEHGGGDCPFCEAARLGVSVYTVIEECERG
jgi:hypothetical protein